MRMERKKTLRCLGVTMCVGAVGRWRLLRVPPRLLRNILTNTLTRVRSAQAIARPLPHPQVAAVVTLATLTLRLFKYFAYQQRLAVISEALSRGFGDAAHFLLLFGVLVVFFCVWGYFMFGAQVRRSRSGRAAAGSAGLSGGLRRACVDGAAGAVARVRVSRL